MGSGEPNLLAWVVLLAWFPIATLFFRKFEPSMAAVVTMIAGKLYLPEHAGYPLPVFPDLNKATIPTLAALICSIWVARRRFTGAKPLRGVDRLFLLIVIGDLGTMLTNGDVIPMKEPLPGLSWYDLISQICDDAVVIYGTFLLGRAMVRTTRELQNMLYVCMVLALLYTPICLFEFKMGPQANVWVYGFMQHDPSQAARGGGFRPLGFTQHGLVLARFMLITVLSGLTLLRLKTLGPLMKLGLFALILIFINLKSMGVFIMALACGPLIVFGGYSAQLRMAIVLAVIVILFPVLRGSDLIPTDTLIEWSSSINENRGASLGARFDNEDALLAKARERIVFGWGGYARDHVYDEEGKDISTTDGEWIIVLGMRGVVGFVGVYGLYLFPVYMAWRKGRRLRTPQARTLIGAFALMTVLMAVDTLPNASMNWPHMFWSGALAGATEGILRQDRLIRLRALWQRRAKIRSAAAIEAAQQPA